MVLYNYTNMVPSRLDMMFHVYYIYDDMHGEHTNAVGAVTDKNKSAFIHQSVNDCCLQHDVPLYSSRKFLSAMPPPLILRLEDRSSNLEAYLSLRWTTAPPSHQQG